MMKNKSMEELKIKVDGKLQKNTSEEFGLHRSAKHQNYQFFKIEFGGIRVKWHAHTIHAKAVGMALDHWEVSTQILYKYYNNAIINDLLKLAYARSTTTASN